MRKALLTGLALALLLAAGGCGDSLDSVAREEIKLTDQKAAVLEDVKDKESAEAARPRLEKLSQEMKGLKERKQRLAKDQKPEKLLEAALKYQEAEEKARARLRQARAKALQNKDVAAVLKGLD